MFNSNYLPVSNESAELNQNSSFVNPKCSKSLLKIKRQPGKNKKLEFQNIANQSVLEEYENKNFSKTIIIDGACELPSSH